MAFQLSFTTADANKGKSLMVNDASTDWPTAPVGVLSAKFTISSLYAGVTFNPTPRTVTIPIAVTPFALGFSYEIKNTDLGFGVDDTIDDSVYRIKMELNNIGGIILGAANTWTSDEVWYYNAVATRTRYIASTAKSLNIYDKNQEYANWLDFLVTSIESNTLAGNSSGIYLVFDIYPRLNEV